MLRSQAPPDSETKSVFLSLPVEIRYSIYDYLLWSPHLVIVSDNPSYSRNQGIHTALSRTSRKLREEIRDFLWNGVLRKEWEKKQWWDRLASGRDIETIWYCDNIPSLRPLGVCNASTTTVVREFCPGKATVMSPPLKVKDLKDIRALLQGVSRFRVAWRVTDWRDYISLTENMKQALIDRKGSGSQSCGDMYLEKRRGSETYDWWDEDGARGILPEETP